MCKAGFFGRPVRPAFDRALHSLPPLSTAASGWPVQMVGNVGSNAKIFAGLPAFHFASARFSKTWTGLIDATCLVSGLLSTFPAATVTTTNKEYIFSAFHSSRDACRPAVSDSDRESTETTRLRFSCGFGVV
jgi:hypothetical protein